MDKKNNTIINYKNYELKFDGVQYYTFKPRPYNDAIYYTLRTSDKINWDIIFNSHIVEKKICSFEDAIDYIEDLNQKIKPIMVHL